jgi:hypothetical protein
MLQASITLSGTLGWKMKVLSRPTWPSRSSLNIKTMA